jgi:hypothetical protein
LKTALPEAKTAFNFWSFFTFFYTFKNQQAALTKGLPVGFCET